MHIVICEHIFLRIMEYNYCIYYLILAIIFDIFYNIYLKIQFLLAIKDNSTLF
jgi:hypothetical protein